MIPSDARARFRAGLVTPTSGWCDGYTQANLISVPRDLAWDFLLFAQRNPKPCPVLDVAMYRTSWRCRDAGAVTGPLVVSMRPVPAGLVETAAAVTARFPAVHGAPVHVGDPAELGIADLDAPDHGDPVRLEPGDVPVFWACGVTPQAAVVESRPPLAIAHAPGHMLITDVRDDDYRITAG